MLTQEEHNELARILSTDSFSDHRRILAGDALRAALVGEKRVDEAVSVASQVVALGITALANETDADRQVEIYEALGRAYVTKAPFDFHCYLIALEWDRQPRHRFYQPRLKVLKPVVDALTAMIVDDAYDIILLSMPPRVGKSTLGLLFLSWVAGRNPDGPILATGYAEKITKMFYDSLLEIYTSPEYRFKEIFPAVELVHTSAEYLTLDFRNDGKTTPRKYKTITCRPVDGALTGATEARQLLYCDDLVSGLEEALSPARLRALRDKMITNVYSRKKEGCKELHIGTRWSVHDPLGWIEQMHRDDPRCRIIKLPALDPETDESNFEYEYGVGFSTEHYRALREMEDDVTWQCVYQQEPVERAGLLFPAETLTFTYSVPDTDHNPPDDIFAFCDVAFGGSNYLAMPVAYQYGDDPPIIVDVVYLTGDYKTTEPLVAGALTRWNVRRAIFEANNGGDFYSRDIARLVAEAGHKCHITTMRAPAQKSKETRILQHSPVIKTFSFLHPSVAPPMYKQFLIHLTTYSQQVKNQMDDAPDALAGLATMMRANTTAKLSVYDRRYI